MKNCGFGVKQQSIIQNSLLQKKKRHISKEINDVAEMNRAF
jgi:uncharacterized protein YeeX (DUF496 family)